LPTDIDGLIKTIGENYSWASPAYIDTMFCDDLDHHGLVYWYNHIEAQHKEIERQKPKK
jgi:hypothetical protein